MQRTASDQGLDLKILAAVEAVNNHQKRVLLDKIEARFGSDLSGRCFALWGLAFKPNTDDMREAPARVLLEGLWQRGARVRAHDPVAMDEARHLYGERVDLDLVNTPEEALVGADALVVVTEWQAFRSPDLEFMHQALKEKTLFDGRNLYDPDQVRSAGLRYYGMGRL